MVPVLAFFGVAALAGLLILAVLRWRLRTFNRRPEVPEAELCQLRQANRITSVAVIASLSGALLLGLAYLLVESAE
jgi:uncharacterized iron-regulated membrane protein